MERVSVLAAAKGFMKWDYEKVMPERMGQYKRIIKPVNPVEGLNGSFIIGAYECRNEISEFCSFIIFIVKSIMENFAQAGFP